MANESADSPKRSRLMLVDDHPLVRRGLAELISHEPHLEVCAQSPSGEEALLSIEQAQPDLIVIDIMLPGMSGLELIKRVRARYPNVRILVSSMHDESIFAERCLRAGANGYVNKEVATEHVIDAINQLLEGKVFLSPAMTSRLLHGVVGSETKRQSPLERLSDRELEVYAFIGRGLPTRDIAEKLHLSVKTVETHREHIKAKLALRTTNELLRHAVQWVLENG